MKTQLWLVKQEPEDYVWSTFLRDKKTSWDGVRNYQARNNLKAMNRGDQVLFYASVGPKEVQGVAEVTRTAYPDPTAEDPGWVSVELKAVASLPKPVSLAQIKADPALNDMALIRQSRLSVIPLTKAQYSRITTLGGL